MDNNILTNPSYIRWQCRRGMLELDLLLGKYFDTYYAHLSNAEKMNFAQLLTYPDQDIYAWLIGRALPPEPSLCASITQIKSL